MTRIARRTFLKQTGAAAAVAVAAPLVIRSQAHAQGDRLVVALGQWGTETPLAWRQTQADKPAAAPAAAAAKEVTIVQGPGQATVKEDARHCLEQSTNTDIIKCAEPYLPVKQKKM